MKFIFCVLIFTASTSFSIAQFKNSNWCFGDSAGINFSVPNNPMPFMTGMRSRGSAVSISANNDTLLFYANTRAATSGNTTLVYNKLHQIMQNGDNIIGRGWYHELIIIPDPADSNLFYLFTAGVTQTYGLYYSIIDISKNGGLGEVLQKNILLQNFPVADGLTAVKHGNGRDWWLLFRQHDPNGQNFTNTFYCYLISPSGISNLFTQNIGTPFVSGFNHSKFNLQGDKLATVDPNGIIDLFDFDRCTGLLSNFINIEPNVTTPPYPFFWSAEFSASDQFLYVSAPPDTSYLFQYDLLASNISLSKDTIWSTVWPINTAGDLKRGPDDKIYFSCGYDNDLQFPYPYQDSVYNMYNMNLGVIHEPDSAGAACNFQPWSFYLGGYRTYWGLPNNPDYELGPLQGSLCDTIVSTQDLFLVEAAINVYYHLGWKKLFLNANNLKGNTYRLVIYDLYGHLIFNDQGNMNPPYFTKDIDLNNLASGMYIVNFQTNKESLTSRFVISK